MTQVKTTEVCSICHDVPYPGCVDGLRPVNIGNMSGSVYMCEKQREYRNLIAPKVKANQPSLENGVKVSKSEKSATKKGGGDDQGSLL